MDWLSNPDDPRVVAALTVKCGMCGAAPGEVCRSVTKVKLNRLTHIYRVEELL